MEQENNAIKKQYEEQIIKEQNSYNSLENEYEKLQRKFKKLEN